MGFKSNGKPGRIYHWNLPVLKKMLSKSETEKSTKLRHTNDINELIDIKNIPTWSSPWENETIEKAFGKYDEQKAFMKKSPSFYGPAKPKKNNFQKYFPGNGKPSSFYVIKKSHHKPYYQQLIP